MTVIRGNTADPHVIELTRETIPAESATVKPLAGGVAHVRVASFGPGTAAALKKIFDGLAGQKLTSAVIDLRGIADGSPEDGIAAARLFVKSGVLAVRAGRGAEPRHDQRESW